MDRASRVAVTGVLAPHAGAFREELSALGYTPRSAEAHLVLMKRLSAWLDATGVGPAALTPECVEDFLAANRAHGPRFPKSARGAEPLVGFLRRRGVVPEAPAVVLAGVDELVERFSLYLVAERGLGAGTVQGYLHTARLFLEGFDSVEHAAFARLDPSMVQAFILAESEHRSVASTKTLVTGLRALLRFLHVAGIIETSLVGAVPTVSGWSGTWLPRSIDAASVKHLLASCDRRSAQGRRDYAALVVLSRLGLRIGEVAALRLDDIDWRRGELVVRGKAGRLEHLPLPADVGRAVADYLRGSRPASEDRRLFLRLLAPHRGLSTGGLIAIVQSACRRAGLVPIAAHRLRHTVASDLLRAGAGLPEIGRLLRHRSPASTAIYTSVDVEALRTLARPWPGARP
jgi:integrase/recombinase XerD